MSDISTPKRVLVIDDDMDVGEFIAAAARSLGMDCTVTTDVAAFAKQLTPEISLVIMDLVMPGIDGIELLRLLGQQRCRCDIVLMSGIGRRVVETAEKLADSLDLHILGSLHKPFRLHELQAVLTSHTQPRSRPVSGQSQRIGVLDDDLRRAIKYDEFILHYQPQIDIPTGRVLGVEALVRWQHPELGVVFPDYFIARAEELNLIDALGWLVVNRALSEVTCFADSHGSIPLLSINISVHSLRDLSFPDLFIDLARRYHVPEQNIVLEITESGLIKELSSTLDVLTRLRLKGVQLSIDDFGTGYAMMQQLRHIPATELKIDRSLVQAMYVNNSDRVLVQKTIEIGHELGMKVIAEGVENQEQLDFLRLNRCDIAQGYLFSRPLAPSDLIPWLTAYAARHAT